MRFSTAPTNRHRGWKFLLIAGLGLLFLGFFLGIINLLRPTAVQQAEQAIARGDLAAAQAGLIDHLKRAGHDNRARYKLAMLLKKTDADSALALFRQIPPDADQYLLALRNIAQICLLSDRDEEAERALHRLNQLEPADHAVVLSLAEFYFHHAQYKQALPYARRCAELRPERAQTFLLLAEVLDELGRPDEMVAPLEQALALEPDLYAAHLNLSYATLSAGELSRAAKEARWCLDKKPDDFYPHWVLAAVARDQGRMDVAQREIGQALKLKPHDLDCRLLEADLLMYRREFQTAYEKLKPLYQEHHDQARYLGALARAAAATGRAEEAQTLQQQIARFYSERTGE